MRVFKRIRSYLTWYYITKAYMRTLAIATLSGKLGDAAAYAAMMRQNIFGADFRERIETADMKLLIISRLAARNLGRVLDIMKRQKKRD